ncbi:hypothetical protein BASA50_005142 [Batrachochytrium salamandrivorans]|uniref:Uncharacterized protein n=1 Tax=Batrachochytrium salamandrivorans TaxID=1357716 RepID=A0ABQ8FEW1_9FUNG|nr:hypothetical protein BASA61_009062 [Batrachochytrium salamandrivorans]KAH6596436.1 hypothetical protein BASA50_005142 [Batrachochytrium salamandrivorans]KAH9265394.1 hypothetical protein BASA84_001667 [Batrachochytrium salamandrivorans]
MLSGSTPIHSTPVRFYRTLDPISALRIQATLYALDLDSATHISALSPLSSTADESLLASKTACAHLQVAWQEKAVAPTSPKTTSHSHVLKPIVTHPLQGRHKVVLFTYIDSDRYYDKEPLCTSLTSGRNDLPTSTAQRIHSLNPDGLAVERAKLSPALAQHADSENHLSDSAKIRSGGQWGVSTGETMCTEMHIMASIPCNAINDSVIRIEKRLCSIRYYNSGLLSVSPGFSKDDTQMHSMQIGEQMYAFSIKNISGTMTKEEKAKEQEIFEEFHLQHAMTKLSLFAKPFEIPVEPGHTQLHIRGEIVSAIGFTGDWIYAEYTLDASDGCAFTKESQTKGISQVAQVKLDSGVSFSLPFEAILMCPEEEADVEIHAVVLLKIRAVDSWDRHTVVGYGAVRIPSQPGHYRQEVGTWCHVPPPINKMTSFFLGGSPDIQDLTYLRDVSLQTKVVNKYGFKTETSGSLQIRMDISKQHRKEYGTEGLLDHVLREQSEHSDVLLRANARLEALREARRQTEKPWSSMIDQR